MWKPKVNELVIYVPNHAKDIFDSACEIGKVFRVTDNYVFVTYVNRQEEYESNPKATSLHNLVKYPFSIGDEIEVAGVKFGRIEKISPTGRISVSVMLEMPYYMVRHTRKQKIEKLNEL